MCKVSIIVPVYGVEDYICPCVESALNQTFTDFELILVDDGSPDGCGAILDEYALSDRRVRVIHKENGGLSSARNAGLDVAKGKYIYFLDGDDAMFPNLLETAVPQMDEGFDLVAFNFEAIMNGVADARWGRYIPERREYLFPGPEARWTFLYRVFGRCGIHWEAWNRIFRRDLIEQWHIRFADNRKIFAEDLCFSYCYLAHARRVLTLPDALYHYIVRPDSITALAGQRLHLAEFEALAEEVLAHFDACPDCAYLSEHPLPLWYMVIRAPLLWLKKYHKEHRVTLPQIRTMLQAGVADYPRLRMRLQALWKLPGMPGKCLGFKRPILRWLEQIYIAELVELPLPRPIRLLRRSAVQVYIALYRLRRKPS